MVFDFKPCSAFTLSRAIGAWVAVLPLKKANPTPKAWKSLADNVWDAVYGDPKNGPLAVYTRPKCIVRTVL